MELMSVQEYSKEYGVSVQSVYQRIKRGSIDYEEKDGVKYIQVENKPSAKPKMQDECKKIIKEYKSIIKDLKKQIKELKKDKDQNYDRLVQLFNIAVKQNGGFSALKYHGEDVIDVPTKKKKKKKK